MVMITLYARQQKRHRWKEESHSDMSEMIPRCGFDLHISGDEWC